MCSNQAAEIIGLGMWLSMLAWPVVLAFALVMKLGEYGRAADPALPADIYLPHVAMRLVDERVPPALYATRSTSPRKSRQSAVSAVSVDLDGAARHCADRLPIRQIRNEEIVLSELFPENLSYKRKTAGIILGLY